jgi:hypothetical protein
MRSATPSGGPIQTGTVISYSALMRDRQRPTLRADLLRDNPGALIWVGIGVQCRSTVVSSVRVAACPCAAVRAPGIDRRSRRRPGLLSGRNSQGAGTLRRQGLGRTDFSCHRLGAARMGDRASSSRFQRRPPSSASFDYSRLRRSCWRGSTRAALPVGQPIAGRSLGGNEDVPGCRLNGALQ